MSEKKLRIYELRWHKTLKCWCLYMKVCGKMEPILSFSGDKPSALHTAAWLVKENWTHFGIPTRLMICTKSGRYVKGNGGERSYGADSKRRKG